MIEQFFFLSTNTVRIVVFLLVPIILYYRDRERLPSYLVSLFFVLVITYSLKYGLNVPRPEGAALDIITPRFPSGHTSLAFTPLLFFRSWKSKAVLLVYGVVVAYSRLYFNLHVPIDIAASVGIALCISFVSLKKKGYIRRKFHSFLGRF